MTDWTTLSLLLAITVFTEAIALYAIQAYAKTTQRKYLYTCMAIYGFFMPFMLYHMLKFEDIGMVNFLWNIFSTMSGFLIGVMLFQEKTSTLQWIGVAVGCISFALIILGNGARS